MSLANSSFVLYLTKPTIFAAFDEYCAWRRVRLWGGQDARDRSRHRLCIPHRVSHDNSTNKQQEKHRLLPHKRLRPPSAQGPARVGGGVITAHARIVHVPRCCSIASTPSSLRIRWRARSVGISSPRARVRCIRWHPMPEDEENVLEQPDAVRLVCCGQQVGTT